MCRYASSTYKSHYVCFECRKTFKRRLLWDIAPDKAKNRDELPAKCPECSQLMANMGKDFESPKKRDIKGWDHMKSLYEVGIVFHSCGCTGPGYIPRDKVTLLELLKARRVSYNSCLTLGLRRLRTEEVPKEIEKLNEAVHAWRDKLNKIDQYIASIKKAIT